MTPTAALLFLSLAAERDPVPDRALMRLLDGRGIGDCARPARDLDGDGELDVVCATYQASEELGRLTVVLSSLPTELALDASLVPCDSCKDCQEWVGFLESVDIYGGSQVIRFNRRVSYTNEVWMHTYMFAWDDSTEFDDSSGVARKDQSARESRGGAVDGGASQRRRVLKLWREQFEVRRILRDGELLDPPEEEAQIDYSPERVWSSQVVRSAAEESYASWDDIFVIPEGRPSVAASRSATCPYAREALGIHEVEVGASESEARHRETGEQGREDFSFVVRARSRGEAIRVEIDVKDDDVRFGSDRDGGRRPGDRVEFWWDERANHWGDNGIGHDWRMTPDPTTTNGLLATLQPNGRVSLSRLFPEKRPVAGLQASWKRSSSGYVLTLRFERRLVEPKTTDDEHSGSGAFDERGALIGATLIVHNAYGVDGEKSMATAHVQHVGAPFELGWMHLPPRARGKQRRAP